MDAQKKFDMLFPLFGDNPPRVNQADSINKMVEILDDSFRGWEVKFRERINNLNQRLDELLAMK